MVGRHWESAEGTIVATQVAVQTAAGYVNRLEYAVDVHPASGPVVRVTLREPKFIKGGFSQPAVGDVVGVLFDAKSNNAKFDTSDPRLKIKRPRGCEAGGLRSGGVSKSGNVPTRRL